MPYAGGVIPGLTKAAWTFRYRGAADTRKSFDGGCGLFRAELQVVAVWGSVRLLQPSAVAAEGALPGPDGLAIWMKNLEHGTSHLPLEMSSLAEIGYHILPLLLEEENPRRLHRRCRLGA